MLIWLMIIIISAIAVELIHKSRTLCIVLSSFRSLSPSLSLCLSTGIAGPIVVH